MKKLYLSLLVTIGLGSFPQLSADNLCYTFHDSDGQDMYGCLRRVSPNGQWAVGGDESDQTGCLIVNTSNPESYVHDPNGFLLDVDDSGMAVGSWYDIINTAKYPHAATYKDGVWTRLPEPEEILGRSCAVAISADSKTIVGHALCANEAPDEPGRYFPVVWRLNETTGAYELDRLYNNLYLPGTYGFFVQDMTPDGKYAFGYQSLDFASIVGGIFNIETGEYENFHNIEYIEVAEEAYGKVYYMDRMFVDGLLEGFDETTRFNGMFAYATDRYIYGSRGMAYDVQPDGSGKIRNMATIYDLEEMDFIDGAQNTIYRCGLGTELMFNDRGQIIKDGNAESLDSYVGNGTRADIVYGIDDAAKILVGARIAYTGWGDAYESPVLIYLDESILSGIESVSADASQISVNIEGGVLTVYGAKDVEVYSAAGALVSTSPRTKLAHGVYVVNADGRSRKVVVK